MNKRLLNLAPAILIYLTVCIGVCSVSAWGQDTDATPSDLAKSELRDPFWPVGYYPESFMNTEEEEPEENIQDTEPEEKELPLFWDEAQRQIMITGNSDMGRSGQFAIINGQLLKEGDFVTIDYKDYIYQWELMSIDEGAVKLKRAAAVPKKRRK